MRRWGWGWVSVVLLVCWSVVLGGTTADEEGTPPEETDTQTGTGVQEGSVRSGPSGPGRPHPPLHPKSTRRRKATPSGDSSPRVSSAPPPRTTESLTQEWAHVYNRVARERSKAQKKGRKLTLRDIVHMFPGAPPSEWSGGSRAGGAQDRTWMTRSEFLKYKHQVALARERVSPRQVQSFASFLMLKSCVDPLCVPPEGEEKEPSGPKGGGPGGGPGMGPWWTPDWNSPVGIDVGSLPGAFPSQIFPFFHIEICPELASSLTEEMWPIMSQRVRENTRWTLATKYVVLANRVIPRDVTKQEDSEHYRYARYIHDAIIRDVGDEVTSSLSRFLAANVFNLVTSTVTLTVGKRVGEMLARTLFAAATRRYEKFNFAVFYRCYYQYYECQYVKQGRDCKIDKECGFQDLNDTGSEDGTGALDKGLSGVNRNYGVDGPFEEVFAHPGNPELGNGDTTLWAS